MKINEITMGTRRLSTKLEEQGNDSKLTSPLNTIVVDTPSDLDWYKLGQHFPTLGNLEPGEFGAGGSDTVITFANRAEADKFRKMMAQKGVRTKDIGGSHTHPEIHTSSMMDEQVNEITMDPRTGKGALKKGELDEFIARAYPVGKVKGYEIRLFDEDEPEEFHYLIKDPDNESFLGYMSFIQGRRDKFYRSNVFFDPSIQGKGLGVELYAFGIKHSGQTLVSDSTQTKGSQELWKRLSQHPDINVYGWDVEKNEYFHWNPDEDDDGDVWRDDQHESEQIAMLRKKMVAVRNDLDDGKISQQEFDQLTKQYRDESDDIQNQGQNWRNDIRLVATTK